MISQNVEVDTHGGIVGICLDTLTGMIEADERYAMGRTEGQPQ